MKVSLNGNNPAFGIQGKVYVHRGFRPCRGHRVNSQILDLAMPCIRDAVKNEENINVDIFFDNLGANKGFFIKVGDAIGHPRKRNHQDPDEVIATGEVRPNYFMQDFPEVLNAVVLGAIEEYKNTVRAKRADAVAELYPNY